MKSSNALDRAIEAVNELPNLIRVVEAPKVDKVFRVVPLKGRTLDILNGPQQEEWETIKRTVYLRAPLEERTIEPVAVGTQKEWTLTPEDVPVVHLQGDLPESLGLEKAPKMPQDESKATQPSKR